MGLQQRIADTIGLQLRPSSTRSGEPLPLTFDQWTSWFRYQGLGYPLGLHLTMSEAKEELADGTFPSIARTMYTGNGVVFACELVRLLIFSEARFQWRRLSYTSKPGELFGSPELSVLEHPWPGGTTGDLLTRMLLDADLAGNCWQVRRKNRIVRLRPDWVTVVMGVEGDPTVSIHDVDATVLGILYHPGGRGSGATPETFLPGQYAHFAPIPDPMSPSGTLGMSWLTPLIREVAADSAATHHKLRFFENGATPNLAVKLDPQLGLDAFNEWVAAFKEQEPVGDRVYKTLYLGGGADVTVVGTDMRQLDFKVTQGAGETRIAAAAGVPPVIVGLSEGLQGSSLNAGNYGMARRRLGDVTMRPNWRNACGSLEVIVPPPDASSELWYDASGIPFLRDDQKDEAEIQAREAQTIRTLIDAGYEAESVVAAVVAKDWKKLDHTGLFSVQLQPPGTVLNPEPVERSNGHAPGQNYELINWSGTDAVDG